MEGGRWTDLTGQDFGSLEWWTDALKKANELRSSTAERLKGVARPQPSGEAALARGENAWLRKNQNENMNN